MDIREMEILVSNLYNSWWSLDDEVSSTSPNYEKIDLISRQMSADLTTVKEMAYELKRKEVVK